MRVMTCGAACAFLLFTSLVLAQSPSAPNQVVETGNGDDTILVVAGQQVHVDPQTGQMRQPTAEEAAALAAALRRQFGKSPDAVTFATLSNGVIVALLDDSFAEAMTVTRSPDGTLAFGHVTGLAKASTAVKSSHASAKAATKRPAKAARKESREETE